MVFVKPVSGKGMLRRKFIRVTFKVLGSAFVLLRAPKLALSGSGSSDGGDSSSDGGGSSSSDDGGGSSSGGGGSSSSREGRSSDSSSGPSTPSGPSAPSTPSAPSGPSDSLSGSGAGDERRQSLLLNDLEGGLADDGLEPVSEDNLQSVLEAFR